MLFDVPSAARPLLAVKFDGRCTRGGRPPCHHASGVSRLKPTTTTMNANTCQEVSRVTRLIVASLVPFGAQSHLERSHHRKSTNRDARANSASLAYRGCTKAHSLHWFLRRFSAFWKALRVGWTSPYGQNRPLVPATEGARIPKP